MSAALRAQLAASRLADQPAIELYGSILEEANVIRSAGQSICYCTLQGHRPSRRALADAKAAAERLIATIDQYTTGEGA